MLGYDGMIYQALKRFSDRVIAHLLWLVCSLPIVTLGASTGALYHALLERRMGSELPISELFWQGFRQYGKKASGLFWLLALGGLVLCSNTLFWNRVAQGVFAEGMALVTVALWVPYLLICLYAFGVLQLYPTQSIKEILVQALYTAYANPFKTLRLAARWGVLIWLNLLTVYINVMTLLVGFGVFLDLAVLPVLSQTVQKTQCPTWLYRILGKS